MSWRLSVSINMVAKCVQYLSAMRAHCYVHTLISPQEESEYLTVRCIWCLLYLGVPHANQRNTKQHL